MEFSFLVEINNPELIISDEYKLFWFGNKNTISPDEIGYCKVTLNGNMVNCIAVVESGGIRHLINDVVISEFNSNGIFSGKYEYGILLKEDAEGNDYVHGICLS